MVAKTRFFMFLVQGLIMLQYTSFAQSAPAIDNCECSHACRCHFLGTVIDATTNEPLPFATIKVKAPGKMTISDEHGHFVITNLCECTIELEVTYTGYKTFHKTLAFNNKKDIIIKLAEQSKLLESVEVIGELTDDRMATMAYESIKKESIERLRGENIATVLQKKSGMNMIQTGNNVAKPVLNGMSGNRIQILNNDIRYEGQQWGAEHAPAIDIFGAHDITIVKGASSVKYGANAMGGVILINPEPIHMHNWLAGEAHLIGLSNGLTGAASLMLEGGFKKPEHMGWRVQGSAKKGGDLSAAEYELDNTGMSEYSFSAAMAYQWGKYKTEASYTLFQSELGLLKTLGFLGSLEDLSGAINREEPAFQDGFSYNINAPKQSVTHQTIRLKMHRELKNGYFTGQYAFQKNDRREYDIRRGNLLEIPAMDLELRTHTIDLQYHSEGTSKNKLNIGLSGLLQQNRNIPGTQTIPFIPNYFQSTTGLFVIDKYQINSRWNLEAGIRYDWQYYDISGFDYNNQRYFEEINLQSTTAIAGLIWNINPSHSIKSNFGLAWRPPHVSELYSFGKHQSAAAIEYGLLISKENTGIISWDESGVSSENSYKWITQYDFINNSTRFNLAAYLQHIRNYIYLRPERVVVDQRGASPAFWYNQTTAVFQGIDAQFEQKLTEILYVEAQSSIIRARDILNNDYFLYIPADRYNLSIGIEDLKWKRFKNIYANIGANLFIQQRNVPRVIPIDELIDMVDSGEDPFEGNNRNFDLLAVPDDYLLMNFSIGITIPAGNGTLDGRLSIDNLLNTSYRSYTNRLRYFADDLGRNTTISLTYHF